MEMDDLAKASISRENFPFVLEYQFVCLDFQLKSLLKAPNLCIAFENSLQHSLFPFELQSSLPFCLSSLLLSKSTSLYILGALMDNSIQKEVLEKSVTFF